MKRADTGISIFRAVASAISIIATIGHWGSLASAAGYPDRPIRLVVPYSAGSNTDGIARHVATKVIKSLKIKLDS